MVVIEFSNCFKIIHRDNSNTGEINTILNDFQVLKTFLRLHTSSLLSISFSVKNVDVSSGFLFVLSLTGFQHHLYELNFFFLYHSFCVKDHWTVVFESFFLMSLSFSTFLTKWKNFDRMCLLIDCRGKRCKVPTYS